MNYSLYFLSYLNGTSNYEALDSSAPGRGLYDAGAAQGSLWESGEALPVRGRTESSPARGRRAGFGKHNNTRLCYRVYQTLPRARKTALSVRPLEDCVWLRVNKVSTRWLRCLEELNEQSDWILDEVIEMDSIEKTFAVSCFVLHF